MTVAYASAPILPVSVNRVVYTGAFIRDLQSALIRAGYDVGPAGVDGAYGPATAGALARFQSDHPQARDADQLPGYIPYQIGGCHTYRALGLDVWTSYCRGGVSAEGAVCDAVMAADAAGTINLKCVAIGGGLPAAPGFLPAWAWVAIVGTAFAVGYGAGRYLAHRTHG